MNDLLAIDPGTKQSAWIFYSPNCGAALDMAIESNERVIERIKGYRLPIACEMIASYGMPVGREVFETCLWVGRFIQVASEHRLIYRKDVKMHLCNSVRAKDSNIRQALIDLYPATGGGKTPQIGTKAKPGPLYGFKSHLWAALAVAHTHSHNLGAQ